MPPESRCRSPVTFRRSAPPDTHISHRCACRLAHRIFDAARPLQVSAACAHSRKRVPSRWQLVWPCQLTFTAPACDEKEAPRWFEPQGCLRAVRTATPQTEPKPCTRWRRRIEPTPPAINHTTNAGKRMPLAAAGIDARRETRTHARLPRWTTHALHAAQ